MEDPIQASPTQIDEAKNNRGVLKVGILLVVLISALAILFWSLNFQPTSSTINNKQTISTLQPNITPTPIPFVEMTIPHLRQRTYDSKLTELQRVSANSSYVSYLTSYTSDGLKINGLLTEPTDPKPDSGWPAIVFVHGYIPPSSYQTLERYGDYVDFLARNGFVVFKIDLRGHGDSEGEPGGGYYSSDYVIDTLNAYSALQHSDFVNKDKIGLWGHSMAGNVLLRSWAAKPEIKAVVVWAGAGYTYLDLRQFGISDKSYRPVPNEIEVQRKRQEMLKLYGNPDLNSPFWKQVIPTNYLSDIKGAIQLNHAVDDNTVSIEYSRNLNKILDQTSIPHEFHQYPSGDHNISGPSFTQAMQNTVQFFKKYLD